MCGCEPLLWHALPQFIDGVCACVHTSGHSVQRADVCGYVCEWELWGECRAPVGTPYISYWSEKWKR